MTCRSSSAARVGRCHEQRCRDQQAGLMPCTGSTHARRELREQRVASTSFVAFSGLLHALVQRRRVSACVLLYSTVLPPAEQAQRAERHAADDEPAVLAPPLALSRSTCSLSDRYSSTLTSAARGPAILCRARAAAEQIGAFFDDRSSGARASRSGFDADAARRDLGFADDHRDSARRSCRRGATAP